MESSDPNIYLKHLRTKKLFPSKPTKKIRFDVLFKVESFDSIANRIFYLHLHKSKFPKWNSFISLLRNLKSFRFFSPKMNGFFLLVVLAATKRENTIEHEFAPDNGKIPEENFCFTGGCKEFQRCIALFGKRKLKNKNFKKYFKSIHWNWIVQVKQDEVNENDVRTQKSFFQRNLHNWMGKFWIQLLEQTQTHSQSCHSFVWRKTWIPFNRILFSIKGCELLFIYTCINNNRVYLQTKLWEFSLLKRCFAYSKMSTL